MTTNLPPIVTECNCKADHAAQCHDRAYRIERAGNNLRDKAGLLIGALRLKDFKPMRPIDEYRKEVEQAICEWNKAVSE